MKGEGKMKRRMKFVVVLLPVIVFTSSLASTPISNDKKAFYRAVNEAKAALQNGDVLTLSRRFCSKGKESFPLSRGSWTAQKVRRNSTTYSTTAMKRTAPSSTGLT